MKQVFLFATILVLSFCISTAFSHKHQPIKVSEPVHATGPIECEVCKLVVSYSDKFLEENSTETEIQDWLENHVCTYLIGLQGACDTFVTQYENALVLYFINDFYNEQEICTNDLQVC